MAIIRPLENDRLWTLIGLGSIVRPKLEGAAINAAADQNSQYSLPHPLPDGFDVVQLRQEK
jgi:hypothetical protein